MFVEKLGQKVGTGAIMSYARNERVKSTKRVVDGGSKFEIISAGFTSGNMAKIIIGDKQVQITRNSSEQIKMSGATMSTNYRKGDKDEAAA